MGNRMFLGYARVLLLETSEERFRTVGIDLPKSCQSVLDLRTALTAVSKEDVTYDLRISILAGKHTTASASKALRDAALTRAAQQHMTDLLADLEDTFELAFAAALRNAGDDLLERLRGPFNDAAAELVAVAEQLGPGEPGKHIRSTPAGVIAIEQRRRAVAQLDAVRQCRLSLAAAGYGNPHEELSWWFDRIDGTGHNRSGGPRWKDDIHAPTLGNLRLNLPDEATRVAQGAAAVDAQQAQAEADAQAALHAAQNERAERLMREYQDRMTERLPKKKAS